MAKSDRRSTLPHSYENAAVIVSGITVDQVGQPTACPGYDVAGLIDHIVEAARRAAALGRGQTRVPRHGGTGIAVRGRGAAAPGADDWERLAAFMGRDLRASLG